MPGEVKMQQHKTSSQRESEQVAETACLKRQLAERDEEGDANVFLDGFIE